jgi:hypothetical protein
MPPAMIAKREHQILPRIPIALVGQPRQRCAVHAAMFTHGS